MAKRKYWKDKQASFQASKSESEKVSRRLEELGERGIKDVDTRGIIERRIEKLRRK